MARGAALSLHECDVRCDGFQRFATNAAPIAFYGSCVFCKLSISMSMFGLIKVMIDCNFDFYTFKNRSFLGFEPLSAA